jgi:hypothetical protein
VAWVGGLARTILSACSHNMAGTPMSNNQPKKVRNIISNAFQTSRDSR